MSQTDDLVDREAELLELLDRARDLLYSAGPGPDVSDVDHYLDAVADWQRDVKSTIDN